MLQLLGCISVLSEHHALRHSSFWLVTQRSCLQDCLRLRTNCVELVLLGSRSVKNETDLENILEKRLGSFWRQGDVLNEVHPEAQAP